jgi:choline dehydrogenase-like flavoprotein
MIMTESYDVIIVGTGAGGGTLARTLAPSGKRILLLERGDFLTRERENWDPGPVFVDGRYISPDTWYDGAGTPFQPQVHYFVGGATKMYGAALYRLRPQDFAEIRHADGISPAWPVGYDEFEPWYTKAEWLYQVHGAHGADPTEGSWSRQYPWPPVSNEPRIQEISDALERGGYHPFPAPCGILLNEADRPASECIRCATCDGYPCLVHAKADADIIAVRPLLGLPTVTLLTRAEVVRLETDPAGRTVTGVVVDRGGDGRGGPGGKEEVYRGDIVVLAAGAANTAKILLRSASAACPAGLANGSDQVGRNYMYHNSKAAALYAEFRRLLNHIGMPEHHVLHKNFYMSMNVPTAGVAHQAGTCRFGADPATSVLDVNCKAHEVDNLYVADTSFFPSIGAVNPALTAIANAIRVGEHIAERLGASVSGSAQGWAPAQRQAPAETAEAPSAERN